MTDTEAVVAYLFLFLGRKAESADDPRDWAGERLHALVAPKLGDGPAWRLLVGEADAGREKISSDTMRRMALALVPVAEGDPGFARALAGQLQICHAAEAAMQPTHPQDEVTVGGEPAFLADYVRFGGPDNPGIRSVRDNLADYLNQPEYPNLGLRLLQSMAADCAYPGPEAEHPFAPTARGHLARFLAVTGHPAAATAAFEALLSDCIRLLGAEHPVVLGSDLALFLGGEVSPAEATEAFEALLANASTVLGPEHPAIVNGRDHLDGLRDGLVTPVPVAAALAAPLADFLHVLGPDHAVILKARGHLGGILAHAAGPAAAAGALHAVLVDCLRALGPDHIVTRGLDHSFGYWYTRARFESS
ncbi:hypothetical protein ABH931_004310 [Streptacidiphilus sp. MAP12-33]|uniref:tetratricopeptide repeat protein n=1 Tax=Streptacidiphilus sp. MAP12-33 TaxID=3156266 RepID=UPI0035130EED